MTNHNTRRQRLQRSGLLPARLPEPIDPALEISDVRLEFKSGGKRGHWTHPKAEAMPKTVKPPRLGKAMVITVSDRVSAKKAVDRSGFEAMLKRSGHVFKMPDRSPTGASA